jgi:hypothetical protein
VEDQVILDDLDGLDDLSERIGVDPFNPDLQVLR